MSNNLVVSAGEVLELHEVPHPSVAAAMEQPQMETFSDLVRAGMVRSDEELERLLDGARRATREALADPVTFRRANLLPGSRTRVDLQRFPRVLSKVPNANRAELDSVWRLAREIEPTRLSAVSPTTRFVDIGLASRLKLLRPILFRFLDVVVEPGAMLRIKSSVSALFANDVLIRRSGRIVVEGAGLQIRAHSIQGEQ